MLFNKNKKADKNGHYLTGKETREIAKNNAKWVKELERKKNEANSLYEDNYSNLGDINAEEE